MDPCRLNVLHDPNDIDFNNAGSWPTPVKAVVLAVVFFALLIGGYFLLIKDQYTQLDRVAAEEKNLRQQYEDRAYKVANLEWNRFVILKK